MSYNQHRDYASYYSSSAINEIPQCKNVASKVDYIELQKASHQKTKGISILRVYNNHSVLM